MARVARISIAPVKALALVHPERVELTARGVAGDRRFWLVEADGRLVNDRTHATLVQIRPAWDEQTRRLALSFPDATVVEGVVEPGGPVEMPFRGNEIGARAVRGPWQEAISAFAGEALTLLWADDGAVDRGSRGGAVSLVSRGSLERLREEAGEERPIDGRRFRMLFEVDGLGPHEEDAWVGRRAAVGEAVVALTGNVGRCAITTHDPDTGATDLDVLKVLARYRREGGTEPLPFGVHGTVVEPGPVAVGDIARLLS